VPFMRLFDEEVGRAALEGCLNDGAISDAETFALELTSTSANRSDLAPGIYHAFLAGMSAAATVLFRVGRDTDALAAPTGSTSERLSMFPGSVVARVRVLPGQKVLNARLLSGTGTLYLVPVVAL
jgi:hypothetical protein